MSLRDIHQLPSAELINALAPNAIQVMLGLMRDAYLDLAKKNIITLTMSENQITEEWYICLNVRWPNSTIYPQFIPIPQYGDESHRNSNRGLPPTIDFCFRSDWSRQVYFGAECKLVEANNKTSCDEYIRNGVNRYLEGKYGASFPEGVMIGYVRQTKCADVAIQIKIRINDLNGSPTLNQTEILHPFEEHYVSQHNRKDGISPFKLHHLFFLFAQAAKKLDDSPNKW